ncbi:YunG family protein [Angustibacter luteus]|uniref:Uncharacterized protein n=1 Tax=Angustibacter luteus TaxID=658456 RepID=A0ABW1JKK3_9ACTN
MPTFTLSQVEHAIRGAWSAETTFAKPEYLAGVASPARGQCGPTALVVQDLLGGDLVMADLLGPNGDGVHYWNRLGALDVDLTREQLLPGELLQAERVVERRRPAPDGPAETAYRLLHDRVLRTLGVPAGQFSSASSPTPAP